MGGRLRRIRAGCRSWLEFRPAGYAARVPPSSAGCRGDATLAGLRRVVAGFPGEPLRVNPGLVDSIPLGLESDGCWPRGPAPVRMSNAFACLHGNRRRDRLAPVFDCLRYGPPGAVSWFMPRGRLIFGTRPDHCRGRRSFRKFGHDIEFNHRAAVKSAWRMMPLL